MDYLIQDYNMKSIIFLSFLFSVLAIGCGGTSPKISTAGQTISNSWEGEDVLDLKDNWKPLRPPVIITKADSGDVIALFVGEFAPKIKNEQVVVDPFTDPPDKAIVVFGEPIELRIKVNDAVASPTRSTITTSFVIYGKFETRSFLASIRDLPPGTHTIIAEWRSHDTDAKVRNRTLTVWETVRVSGTP